MVKRRYVPTVRWELFGPGISLPAVWSLWSNKVEPHGFCAVEYRVVAPSPVLAAVFSVATQYVEVTRHEHPFASPPGDQSGEI